MKTFFDYSQTKNEVHLRRLYSEGFPAFFLVQRLWGNLPYCSRRWYVRLQSPMVVAQTTDSDEENQKVYIGVARIFEELAEKIIHLKKLVISRLALHDDQI